MYEKEIDRMIAEAENDLQERFREIDINEEKEQSRFWTHSARKGSATGIFPELPDTDTTISDATPWKGYMRVFSIRKLP